MMTLLTNLVEIVIYVSIGIIFCIIGYFATAKIFKKHFNLTEEVDNHNRAVGVMIAGMFIAIAIVMSGVL